MPKRDSSLNMLIVAAILALGVGYYVPKTLSARNADVAKAADTKGEAPAAAKQPPPAAKPLWAASAPGRVEPMGGEVRVAAQAPGRIADVLVALNDKVAAGDLMLSLDDEELLARVHAAAVESAVRKKDRDNADAGGRLGQDRRSGEDSVASSERQLANLREELDRVLRARRNGPGTTAADVQKARDAVTKAREKLEQSRITLRKALAADGLPTPSRQDASLAAARAELSLAEAALQRTRIRAPSAGTVLQVNARIGEIAAPSPEQPLILIGDLSALRVRSEIEERDIGKVRLGQTAIVRSDAFPGKDFEGKIASLAQALGPSRLGQRGPRKPTDVDVLEVLIDLAGQPALLPGMRVDVFFKPDATAQPAAATKASAKAN